MRITWFFLCLFFWINTESSTTAQIIRQANRNDVKDTIFGKADGLVLDFKQVGRRPYYYDKERLLAIDKLAKKTKNLYRVYRALHAYVNQFGARNFRDNRSIYLLKRLGDIAKELKYYDKARQIYRLILKHYRKEDITTFRLLNDSLNLDAKKKDFVPIEYYYTYAHASANIDTLKIPEMMFAQMGDSVSSAFDDYAPTLTSNGLFMIFSSQRNMKRDGGKYLPNEDMFITRKADSLALVETSQGSKFDTIPWTKAKPLAGINTEFNEGSACMTRAGKLMYFARCGSPKGFGNCDIYVAVKDKKGSWKKTYNLGINVNSQSWDSQPTLSHKEDTLYFASDRLGGFGLSDIYYCVKRGYSVDVDNDTIPIWTKARNLGADVNTRMNEVSPFYHPQYNVLYFSSDGHILNWGGFDIYKTYKKVDGLWAEPYNLGPLVNHKQDEYYFTIDAKAQNLYYAKKIRIKVFDWGVGDTIVKNVLRLHTYPLPMEGQPEATVKFQGVVTDSITGKAFEGIVSIIDIDEGTEVAPKYLKPDGSYRFDLIRDRNYLVIITGEDFFRIEKQFLLKGDTTLNISTPSIKFKKWKFEAIEFEHGSSSVTDAMSGDLDKLVFFLADHPNLGLTISGHTERINPDEVANKKLSQARADAIRDYILNKGKFKADRVNAIGYGSSKPLIQKEENDSHRQANRRVEFEIFKMK